MNSKPIFRKTIRLLVTFLALGAFVSVGAVAAQGEDTQPQAQPETSQTVYEIIQSEPSLSDFEALIEAAALSDNLQQDGPFTVFAPTNEAWEAFNASADTDASMTDVILYHVMNGKYMADDLAEEEAVTTLAGEYLFFSVSDSEDEEASIVLNEGIMVSIADISASNGVVHIIDTVLPFPEENTIFASEKGSPNSSIVEVLADDGRFETLLSLLDQAGLMDELQNVRGNYTLFAPTDEAFDQAPQELVDEWVNDPEGALNTILSYHIINDRLTINQIANDDYLPTLEGRAIAVTTDENIQVYLNGRPVQSFNILSANGVIHVMDEVILP